MSNEINEYPWYQLKYSIAEFMIPKLEEYKQSYIDSGMSIPAWLENDLKQNYSDQEIKNLTEEWVQHLDQMILSFKMVLNYNTGEDSSIPYDEEMIQNGLDLFAKNYQHFWD